MMTMMRSRLRGSTTGPTELRERGYLLVWFSIIITVLFAIAGFSYDFGQRYLEDTKAQRAAHAAALAGVVFRGIPGGDVSATNAALKLAARNGFTNGPGHLTDVVVDLTVPANELKVTIRATADNLFSRSIGVGAQDFYRSSQAAYDITTPLGSPARLVKVT
jgi:Putative Flp pilus-assembly TadE/G-like